MQMQTLSQGEHHGSPKREGIFALLKSSWKAVSGFSSVLPKIHLDFAVNHNAFHKYPSIYIHLWKKNVPSSATLECRVDRLNDIWYNLGWAEDLHYTVSWHNGIAICHPGCGTRVVLSATSLWLALHQLCNYTFSGVNGAELSSLSGVYVCACSHTGVLAWSACLFTVSQCETENTKYPDGLFIRFPSFFLFLQLSNCIRIYLCNVFYSHKIN